MLMWCALCEHVDPNVSSKMSQVKTIDCLAGCEVEISTWEFFKGYTEGRKYLNSWPRHCYEFISALPFQEYTDPRKGFLNFVVKLPPGVLKPDLGPKTYIAYGIPRELRRRDSITKLHCDESNSNERGDTGGALWDIFRREDVKILEEYLLKHSREFRHTYCCPINKVYNPIHDQAYYLTLEHNQEAKRGVWLVSAYLCVPINCYRYEILVTLLGVEPWTFEQHLGEVVFIPAGCPHQVQNLKFQVKLMFNCVVLSTSVLKVKVYERACFFDLVITLLLQFLEFGSCFISILQKKKVSVFGYRLINNVMVVKQGFQGRVLPE
ncbi:putative transcription factor & chromatin remodeling &Metalloenzymes JmjC family [Helianthus annuus]|nr:putative transcription factor & chromatin remodeling &Metalloenzymes JmjC family [Helianthus annuus]